MVSRGVVQRQTYRQRRVDSLRTGVERTRKDSRNALLAAAVPSVISASAVVAVAILGVVQVPELTKDSVSVCVNAQQNVDASLSLLKITREQQLTPRLLQRLETANPEEVDRACGEESEIAKDMLPP